VITLTAKKMFEVIIGTGQTDNIVAVKQTGPVTARDLEKMGDIWL
jgi:hypothetical protein